jgi:hypothetical protein
MTAACLCKPQAAISNVSPELRNRRIHVHVTTVLYTPCAWHIKINIFNCVSLAATTISPSILQNHFKKSLSYQGKAIDDSQCPPTWISTDKTRQVDV